MAAPSFLGATAPDAPASITVLINVEDNPLKGEPNPDLTLAGTEGAAMRAGIRLRAWR